MARFETWLQSDLTRLPNVVRLPNDTFSQDAMANRIGVKVYSDGEAVTLSGTVSANVIRQDGETITVSGSRSGNTAYVDLSSACYAVPGHLEIYLKLTDSGTVTTLGACEGTVMRSRTE